MLGGTPSTQVGAALGDQTQGQVRADTMDLREVDADQLIEQGANVEVECVRLSRRCRGLGNGSPGNGFC